MLTCVLAIFFFIVSNQCTLNCPELRVVARKIHCVTKVPDEVQCVPNFTLSLSNMCCFTWRRHFSWSWHSPPPQEQCNVRFDVRMIRESLAFYQGTATLSVTALRPRLGVLLRWMSPCIDILPILFGAFGNTMRWLWVLAYVCASTSNSSEERTALFWYCSSPMSCKRCVRFQDRTVQSSQKYSRGSASQARTPEYPTRLGGARRNHIRERVRLRRLGTARISKSRPAHLAHASRTCMRGE